MRNRKLSQNHQSQVERKKTGNSSVRAVISVSVCALAALAVSAGGRFVGSERDR